MATSRSNSDGIAFAIETHQVSMLLVAGVAPTVTESLSRLKHQLVSEQLAARLKAPTVTESLSRLKR